MTISLEGFESIERKLDRVLEALEPRPRQAWYNLRQAWELKGGCAYETMRQIDYLKPLRGHYEAYIGGRGVFSQETIQEWLGVTDADLDAYHARHKTGARDKRKYR